MREPPVARLGVGGHGKRTGKVFEFADVFTRRAIAYRIRAITWRSSSSAQGCIGYGIAPAMRRR